MTPNQQSRGTNGSAVLQMIQTLEVCSTDLKNDEASPLLEMAAKALAHLQSHSDTVTADVVDWKVKYEELEQFYSELLGRNTALAERIGDLAEENGQLLVKCEQLEEVGRKHVEKIVDLTDKNKQLECELFFSKELLEESSVQDTATIITDSSSSSFIGDVDAQSDQFEDSIDMELEDLQELDQFEDSLDMESDNFQLDQFKDYLDMELEKFQQLGLLESSPAVAIEASSETTDSESEESSSSCREVVLSDTKIVTSGRCSAVVREKEVPHYMRQTESSLAKRVTKKGSLGGSDTPFEISVVNSLQDKAPETIKDAPRASSMNPLQLLHRMFQTQTQHVYDTVPAMMTSDSLVSLSIDYSISSRSSSDLLSLTPTKKISTRSSSDLLSLTPTKKTMRMSPQPNAQWAIIE